VPTFGRRRLRGECGFTGWLEEHQPRYSRLLKYAPGSRLLILENWLSLEYSRAGRCSPQAVWNTGAVRPPIVVPRSAATPVEAMREGSGDQCHSRRLGGLSALNARAQ
jgi:hypothetical protein